MNDPFEEQLRSTFRLVAQQTTTTHDLGMPPPSPRPSRSRRLVATAALSVLALVGVGVLVATRDDGGPQTVRAAAGEDANALETTRPSGSPAMGFLCSGPANVTLPPRLADQQAAFESMIGKLCASGSLAAANPFASCGVDLDSLRDLFGPVIADLGPQLEQLKAVFAEFEPRIRAIVDDPATKAKLDAVLALMRLRLEGLADPAQRPDLSDPAVRQKLLDDLKAGLEPLAGDTALRAQLESIAYDLRTRLEGLAATPEAQALKEKLEAYATTPQLQAQASELAEKIAACVPR